MISRVKGTQDLLDLKLYNFVINQIKEHLQKYNFKEIQTPILEQIELFHRSVGEHTDIVNKEMFTLTTKGDEILCLRPENTAGIMRAFLNYQSSPGPDGQISTPWKVFSTGPMFRYERPQKGRYRQFQQLSVEVIGSNSVADDAYFISMLDKLFRDKLHLDNYVLLINYLGSAEDRREYTVTVKDFLRENFKNICEKCKERSEKNILRIFDCKNDDCKELYRSAPKIIDSLSPENKNNWEKLKEQLDILSIPYVVAPHLVRGLDYYNKTVFEFISSGLGAQNAFCAGGRYDQLALMIGGKKDEPSIGAAIGIERLLDLIEPIQQKLQMPEEKALNVIIPLSEEQHLLALLLATQLLDQNINIEILFDDSSIKSKMRKANKMGAKYVLILGEEEQKNQTVTIKNMINSTEETINQTKITEYIKP
jgi:histidyl-tRNA synthetase